MFCENCGHEVGATSKFCKKCGIKIVRDVVDDTDSKPLMVKIENNSIGTHAYTKELKEYFERVLEQETIVDELELAKPDIDIYKKVEDLSGYSGAQILFIDDNVKNIRAANEINWNTCLATGDKEEDIFNSCLNFLEKE